MEGGQEAEYSFLPSPSDYLSREDTRGEAELIAACHEQFWKA